MLVVDDEPPIRRFLRTSLTAQGYRVIEAADGEAALEVLKRRNPSDLIVLDLGLPGMDGLEVIRQLRDAGSAVPIVVLSSRDDEAGKVRRSIWAPTIMSPSRSAWRNCWRASAPRCATACSRRASRRCSKAAI